jgi:hypothetical protein
MTADRAWTILEALSAVEGAGAWDADEILQAWQVLIDVDAVSLLGRHHEARARELVAQGLCRPAQSSPPALRLSLADQQALEQVRQRYRYRPRARR